MLTYCRPIVAEKDRQAIYDVAAQQARDGITRFDYVGPDGIRHRVDYIDEAGRRELFDLVAITSEFAVDVRQIAEFDPDAVVEVLALPVLAHQPPPALMGDGDLVAGMVQREDVAHVLAEIKRATPDSRRIRTSGDYMRVEGWSRQQPAVHALLLQFLRAFNAYGAGRFHQREPEQVVRGWYVINPREAYLFEQVDPAAEFTRADDDVTRRADIKKLCVALMQRFDLAPADVGILVQNGARSKQVVETAVDDAHLERIEALWEEDPK
jgi:hypothetical protein